MSALLTFVFRLTLAFGAVIAGHGHDSTLLGCIVVAMAIMWRAD